MTSFSFVSIASSSVEFKSLALAAEIEMKIIIKARIILLLYIYKIMFLK